MIAATVDWTGGGLSFSATTATATWSGGWELTVCSAPVEQYHDGLRPAARGCPALDWDHGDAVDAVEAVESEGPTVVDAQLSS